jgi:uncharacterized protein (TIGR03435 family)
MARRSVGWILLTLLGASVTADAQQPKPKFEVASIKPRETSTAVSVVVTGMPRALPGGGFSATYATVEHLLMFAYDLRDYRIIGGSDWIRRDIFEVRAKAATDAPADQIKLMVRSLLEDRLKLVARLEPREMRHDALVLARPSGAVGPNVFRMDVECTPAAVNELRRKLPDKYPTPNGSAMMSGCSKNGFSEFADFLSFRLGTPVIDATGLAGSFYYVLTAQLPPLSSTLGRPLSDSSGLPALSTALEEQFGLKVQSRKSALQVLVVDSVQHPTEN